LPLLLTACSPTREIARRHTATPPATEAAPLDATTRTVIQTAKSYAGTPYKYGGTTRAGMDCSGLVYTSFLAADKTLPRSSSAMAQTGTPVDRKNLRPGHLVFFSYNTAGKVGHVGLVIQVKNGDAEFIHATTQLGVTTSWLSDPHWDSRFVKAIIP
jgi:cell wall-associated NlpC family hydrolase